MRFIAKIGILVGIFGLVISLVIGASACVGAALHWLMPSVDFGLAIIIGLLSLFVSVGIVMLSVQIGVSTSKMTEQVDDESDEEDESEESQAELIAQHVAEELFNRIDVPSPIGRRRRR